MTVEEKIKDVLTEGDPLNLLSVETVNHDPHPFTVGPKHIEHASDNHGGMLGKETMNAIPCAHKGCNLPYDDHKCDTVAMMSLTRDSTNEQIQECLVKITGVVDESEIDGFTFVKNEFKIKQGLYEL